MTKPNRARGIRNELCNRKRKRRYSKILKWEAYQRGQRHLKAQEKAKERAKEVRVEIVQDNKKRNEARKRKKASGE